MADSFNVNFDTKALLAGLNNYGDTIKNSLRAGAYEASTVIYDEININANKHVKTGLLKSSIYRYREKETTKESSTFYIGVNSKKAPHWHFLEFGTVKQAATPFIRPAYDAKIKLALDRAKQVIAKRIKENK